jgi:hypothetical protein
MRLAPRLVLVVAMALAGCAVQSKPMTICDLPNDRGALAGKEMILEGELSVSDHGSSVREPSCDKGLAIGWWEVDVPRMREFDAAALRLESEPLIVRVRVTGTVVQHPQHDTFVAPYWQLKITSAEVLSVKPRPAGS